MRVAHGQLSINLQQQENNLRTRYGEARVISVGDGKSALYAALFARFLCIQSLSIVLNLTGMHVLDYAL